MVFAFIVLLLVLGLLLLLLEAVMPGLVMGLTGCGLIAASSYLCFSHYGPRIGAVYLAVSLVLAGAVALRAFFWAIRRATITPPEPQKPTGNQDLRIGKTGRVIKELNPTGYVEIEGERHMARSAFTQIQIPRDARVVVMEIDGAYLVVRPENAE